MKDIKQYIDESNKNFKLNLDERQALCTFLGILTKALGEDDEIEELEFVRKELSKKELKELEDVFDTLDDEETYKVINRSILKDDLPLLQKVFKIVDDNDGFGYDWDLIDSYEKICG